MLPAVPMILMLTLFYSEEQQFSVMRYIHYIQAILCVSICLLSCSKQL